MAMRNHRAPRHVLRRATDSGLRPDAYRRGSYRRTAYGGFGTAWRGNREPGDETLLGLQWGGMPRQKA